MPLTDKRIKALQPEKKPRRYFDGGHVPGGCPHGGNAVTSNCILTELSRKIC